MHPRIAPKAVEQALASFPEKELLDSKHKEIFVVLNKMLSEINRVMSLLYAAVDVRKGLFKEMGACSDELSKTLSIYKSNPRADITPNIQLISAMTKKLTENLAAAKQSGALKAPPVKHLDDWIKAAEDKINKILAEVNSVQGEIQQIVAKVITDQAKECIQTLKDTIEKIKAQREAYLEYEVALDIKRVVESKMQFFAAVKQNDQEAIKQANLIIANHAKLKNLPIDKLKNLAISIGLPGVIANLNLNQPAKPSDSPRASVPSSIAGTPPSPSLAPTSSSGSSDSDSDEPGVTRHSSSDEDKHIPPKRRPSWAAQYQPAPSNPVAIPPLVPLEQTARRKRY